jgi:hypothetical protein
MLMVEFYPPTTYTYEQLRNNVLGNEGSLPRTKAIALLLDSDFPQKLKDFELLLENEEESSTIRYLAEISLGKMNIPEAKEILLKNIHIQNEQILTGIFMALGRCGDKNYVDVILEAKNRIRGFARSQAEFAAALISYRLNLEGNELQTPNEEDYYYLPKNAQQMQISEARDEEVRRCLKSLTNESYGIDLAKRPAYQIQYDRGIGMVLFNQSFISQRDLHLLFERKLLVGVFADKFKENGSHSIAYLIFTSPMKEEKKKVNILITRPDGRLVFGGTAEIEDNNARFSIRSISQVGVFPVLLEATIRDNKLAIITAKFSTVIQNKNQPVQIT